MHRATRSQRGQYFLPITCAVTILAFFLSAGCILQRGAGFNPKIWKPDKPDIHDVMFIFYNHMRNLIGRKLFYQFRDYHRVTVHVFFSTRNWTGMVWASLVKWRVFDLMSASTIHFKSQVIVPMAALCIIGSLWYYSGMVKFIGISSILCELTAYYLKFQSQWGWAEWRCQKLLQCCVHN